MYVNAGCWFQNGIHFIVFYIFTRCWDLIIISNFMFVFGVLCVRICAANFKAQFVRLELTKHFVDNLKLMRIELKIKI